MAISKLNLQEPLKAVEFYLRILLIKKYLALAVIFIGIVVRFLSVFIFALTLKVFLTIIDPGVLLDTFNQLLYHYAGFTLNAAKFQIVLILILFSLICFQFLLNKLYLRQYLILRRHLVEWLLDRPLNDNTNMHLHICLDKFPMGFDSIIKSLEILVFYFFLLIGIFFISFLAGFLVILVVPVIILVMVVKSRKEIFVQQEMHNMRKEVTDLTSDIDTLLDLSNQHYSYARNGVTFSDFLSGAAIVVTMSLLLLIDFADAGLSENIVGFTALILVFCIRFAVTYAGELSRSLNKLLQQRIIIENVVNSPFV